MNPTQQQQFDTAFSGLTPAQQSAYKAANPTVGVGGVQQSVSPTGSYAPVPISSATINPNNTPYNIPAVQTTPTTDTLAINNSQAIGKITNAASYTPPVATPETASSKLASLASGIKEKILGTQKEITAAQTDPTLIAKRDSAKALSASIDQMDKDYRDEIKRIKASSGGTVAGQQAALNIAQDRYQNNRANAALSFQVANNDYQSAQDTINAKVKSLQDSNAQELSLYTISADAIRNDLTDSEKITLDANIKAKQDAAKSLETAYASVLETASKNGAPPAVLSAIDVARSKPGATAATLFTAAGQYAKAKAETQVVQLDNGQTVVVDKNTGKIISNIGGSKTSSTDAVATKKVQQAQAQANIESITNLADNLASSAVGTGAFSRSQPGFWRNVGKFATVFGAPQALIGAYQRTTGEQQNFIAGVEQMRSNLNLESLITAKSRGATFGALSDQELRVLASSASKIGTWAVKDSDGNVVGYNTTESNMRKELDKINNFAKLDFIAKGGNPTDLMSSNVQMLPDGTVWSQNSDGTLTQLK